MYPAAEAVKVGQSTQQRAGRKRNRWELSPEPDSRAAEDGALDEEELPPAPSRPAAVQSGA